MIYRLHYGKLFHEFIELEPEAFQDIQLSCMTSEFQKISRDPVEVYTSDEDGGMIFPEFFYDNAVPLFSENVFSVMKEAGVDNLFVREVTVTDKLQEISKKYILGLPPRIRIFEPDGSVNESKTGNYMIFKTDSPTDNNIYITGNLKDVFMKNKPLGMEILEADVLYNSK